MKKNKMLFIFVILVPIMLFAQTERWVYNYNGPANDVDYATSVLFGQDGNIYTAGYSWDVNTYADFIISSLTSTGSQRWVYRYNRWNDYDEAYSLVWGGDGNLYAAGMCNIVYGDFSILSVTPSGNPRWQYHYNGPASYADKANDVVYGADGNIYACGYSNGINTGDDFTVVSVNTSGIFRWVYRLNGGANSYDEAKSIVYGNDGNIYVAGFTGDTTYWRDLTVVSLTTSGTQRWIYTYDGNSHIFGEANSLVWGNDGNLYVAGSSVNSGSGQDFTVLSITPAGNERWVYSTHGTAVDLDKAYKIVYGADGNIYAAGYLTNTTTYNDIAVVSLTNSGALRWVYNRTDYGVEYANSLCYGSDGNIYACGRLYQGASGPDFSVVSLTPTGSQRWIYRYDGTANNTDDALAIVYGADGNLYAAGTSVGATTSWDYTVISLNPALGIEQTNDNCKVNNENFSLYPNPAKTFFNVRLPLSADRSEIKIFDVTGKVVKEIGDCHATARNDNTLRVTLDGIKNGIYFVKVENEMLNEKLVVTK